MEISSFLQNFVNILDDTDASLINSDTQFRTLGEWSSLTALSLIAMVDEEYSVKLTGEDIKTSTTLNDIFNIIQSKI
jgi:acyl carrier protein